MKQRILLLTGLSLGLWLTGKAQTTPAPVSTGYIYPVETTNKSVWIIGQRPYNQQGELVGKGDMDQQLAQAFANIKTALASVQLTTDNIKQITYHVRQLDTQRSAAVRSLQERSLPLRRDSIIEQKNVERIIGDDMLVEVEVIAVKQ